VAYNIDLEDRIDKVTPQLGEITKKKMFGGIAYLLNGNMCFGIHKDSLVLRTSKERSEVILKSEYITPMDITGRPMKGWVFVSLDVLETEEQLLEMLEIGSSFARTLPKK